MNELINLNYTLQSPFKICTKDILMGTSSHFHDDIKLEILPTLIEVFLRHLSFCQRNAFYEDRYNKIHELSTWLFKSFEFRNGSRMSDKDVVMLEFKYLQNKQW